MVLELEAGNEKAWFRHGQACFRLKDFSTALTNFKKVSVSCRRLRIRILLLKQDQIVILLCDFFKIPCLQQHPFKGIVLPFELGGE